jgi:hypothetical protein
MSSRLNQQAAKGPEIHVKDIKGASHAMVSAAAQGLVEGIRWLVCQ